MQDHPTFISADAAYDAREIRQYNRKRGIKSNIPINKRSWVHPKRGRPVWFDPELYKKHNAVERFFSWIEAFKKIVPRYERYAHSFLGLIHLACSIMIARVFGMTSNTSNNCGISSWIEAFSKITPRYK